MLFALVTEGERRPLSPPLIGEAADQGGLLLIELLFELAFLLFELDEVVVDDDDDDEEEEDESPEE